LILIVFLPLMRANSTSMRRLLTLFFLLPLIGYSQNTQRNHTGQIRLKLKKLDFLGSVLYVAAHPDDENTRIITSMANDRLAATAYLSMTRGDGGQNLIGSEIRDVLGLIRTQELLAARRIDGGQQFFTRANDFGFSKSADETFAIWNKSEVMSDVVSVYRKFQPDVIITRFPPDERAGHGHHTASAILAQEAFDLAADSKAYSDQKNHYGVWQAKRLYTNTGRWWNQSINENTPGVITINVGAYSPLLGESFSEIAARSRSQHKSQGFGSKGTRGDQPEYLEFIKGEKAAKDIFEGVNTTWSRVTGSAKVQALVKRAIQEFNEDKPSASVPVLVALRKEISLLPSGVWKDRKLSEVEELILDCAGIFAEVASDFYWASPGSQATIFFELINRSEVTVTIENISSEAIAFDSTMTTQLKTNADVVFKTKKVLRGDQSYSDPYWLSKPHGLGLFTVADPLNIGKPENDPAIQIRFRANINGEIIHFTRPLIYKWTDPVKGELYRPFEIVPPVFINLFEKVIVFSDEQPKDVTVLIKSAAGAVKGNLKLQLPEGWRAEPNEVAFYLATRE
jgi:LmbE family N-acetylglucosaminyl deacetylase